MLNLFGYKYPMWANRPGKRHATIYISENQPADVVTYGTREIQKRMFPVVKFTGFSAEENADALSMQRLGVAMGMIINHAAKSCRMQVNHSGVQNPPKISEVVEDGQKYILAEFPIFMRVTKERQKYINVRVWKGGSAAGSAVAVVPKMIFYELSTMAQFERMCLYVADCMRSQR